MNERQTKNDDQVVAGGAPGNMKQKAETPKKESWLKRVINWIKWVFS